MGDRVGQQVKAGQQIRKIEESAHGPISIALATRSSGSSTGSNSAVAWQLATTSWQRTTLLSFSSPRSGYGFALMSPCSSSWLYLGTGCQIKIFGTVGHYSLLLALSQLFIDHPIFTIALHEPARFSNPCSLGRSRSATQLNVGSRPVI